MVQFIVGAVVGAVAAMYFRGDLRRYMDEKLPGVRERAADKLEALGRGAESALERAKSRIGENVRAGQERLRSVRRDDTEGS
jgi:hypothetical protein